MKNYTTPSKLLSTSNTKTLKSSKKGYTIYSLSLTPSTDNAKKVNLCPKASKGCIATCIAYSGNAFYKNILAGRRNKANYFIEDKDKFMLQLYFEISSIRDTHEKMNEELEYKRNGKDIKRFKKFAIRLNTFSDIPFYAYKFKMFSNMNIYELFPDIQFYDYTKVVKYIEMKQRLKLDNLHLTFSKSETNDKDVKKAIALGANVAVVFSNKLPETYLGLNVIDGDETDLTFTYPKNVIVGIKQKKVTALPNATQLNTTNKHSFFVEI